MSSTPPSRKKYTGRQDYKKTVTYVSVGIQETGTKYPSAGESGIDYKLACTPIQEAEKRQIMEKMSLGSQRILDGTKWEEHGIVPSFKATDKILERVARWTYRRTRGR
jgi:hypothetical protein